MWRRVCKNSIAGSLSAFEYLRLRRRVLHPLNPYLRLYVLVILTATMYLHTNILNMRREETLVSEALVTSLNIPAIYYWFFLNTGSSLYIVLLMVNLAEYVYSSQDTRHTETFKGRPFAARRPIRSIFA